MQNGPEETITVNHNSADLASKPFGRDNPRHAALDAPDIPSAEGSKALGNGEWDQGIREAVSPPAKRQKTGDDTPERAPKPKRPSPPWKKFAADGPTAFVENGRRKSSRTNYIPLDLQPQGDTRQTRSAIPNQTKRSTSKYGGVSLFQTSAHGTSPLSSHGNHKIASPYGKPDISTPSKPTGDIEQGKKRSHHKKASSSPSQSDFRKSTTKGDVSQRPLVYHSHQSSQAANREKLHGKVKRVKTNGCHKQELVSEALDDASSKENHAQGAGQQNDIKSQPAKIRLRLRIPRIDIQRPIRPLEPRKYGSFKEWLEKEGSWDTEVADFLSETQALEEARIRRRILQEAQLGGLLSEGRSQVYQPEEQEEPPKIYAHWDHLINQAVHFRKLVDNERRNHQREAKRVALLCQERWKQMQPKSEGDWQNEAKATMKQVLRHLHQRWAVATSIVERRRIERWEARQARAQKARLNDFLQHHDSILQPRLQGEGDSVSDTDTDASVESSAETDETNMSESDSDEQNAYDEEDKNADKDLTVEQLQKKYAHLREFDTARAVQSEGSGETIDVDPGGHDTSISNDNVESLSLDGEIKGMENEDSLGRAMDLDEVADDLLDESDESDDMADDMGSTEDDDDDSVEDGDGECDDTQSEDHDSPGQQGLLGFFSKHDLQPPKDRSLPNEERAVEDAGSLIRNAGEVQTPHTSTSEGPHIDQHDPSEVMNAREHGNDRIENLDHTTDPPLTRSTNVEEITHEGSPPATPVSMKALKTAVPSLLRGTLREYQHFGLDWLAGLYATETNGILADEMGLGKTIQTIALLAHLALDYQVWGPHLVVVPTSVMLNWEMEFKKFLPGFKILTYYGNGDERRELRKGWMSNDKWNVLITSYSIALADGHIMRRKDWHYMILDEAHNIKNYQSQRWQTMLSFKTRARLLLTGTPLQNNLTELWALLTFLMPEKVTENGIEGFANLEDFLSWFRKPEKRILSGGVTRMDEGDRAIVSKLHKILRPYLLRRLKADVEKQMPGKYEHREFCRLSKRQRELYDGFLERADTRATMASGNHLSIINCLMQLRKVCNHPDLFETRQIVTSFAMPRAVSADFEGIDYEVRRRMTRRAEHKVDLNFVNLVPGANEPLSALDTLVKERLGALGSLRHLASQQSDRYNHNHLSNQSSVQGTLASLKNHVRLSHFERLHHTSYCTSLRSQRRPLYNRALLDVITIDHMRPPNRRRPQHRNDMAEWLTQSSSILGCMVLDLPTRSAACDTLLQQFACITPRVTIRRRRAPFSSPSAPAQIWPLRTTLHKDPFHHARMRLSIAFPDNRLLQYDCGKLQRLATLLRDLQAGGHRALIFTQMTKVLDILEQFLNVHGYLYLRLDGSTKAEQRQALTEKFNNDQRIFCFILSSRSGGIGLNLAGADTVIFYDQDWNPAMDKQCQDRCHRIGQTRDVHIYRLISESTIEANILRTADSKQMLDNVVIQEGDFTTDYFQKMSVRDMLGDEGAKKIGEEATAALDTSLGKSAAGRALQVAEDQEDVVAARQAEKEITQTEEVDMKEGQGQDAERNDASGNPDTTIAKPSAWGGTVEDDLVLEEASSALYLTAKAADIRVRAIGREEIEPDPTPDEYMLRFLEWEREDVPMDADILDRKKRKKKLKKTGHHA